MVVLHEGIRHGLAVNQSCVVTAVKICFKCITDLAQLYIKVHEVLNCRKNLKPALMRIVFIAYVLKFRTLVACQKGLDKQRSPKSDCF